jgi:hypothetical protein
MASAPRPLLAVLLALAVTGCAEAAATPAMPAPRRADAWQQFCEQAFNVPHASSLAAARGADGWELVAMYNGVLCFKRPADPLPRPHPATAPTYVPVVRDPGF